jgi:cell division transport system permease protein
VNIHSWRFYWAEVWQNMRHNPVLTFASVTSAAVALLVLAVFAALSLNVGRIASSMEGQVGIEAFLKPAVTTAQGTQLAASVRAWAGVQSATFVSKQQALAQLEKDFGPSGQSFKPLGTQNPLLDAIYVKATTTKSVAPLAARLRTLSQVQSVNYQAPVVQRLFKAVDIVRLVGLAMGILLALGTLLVIQNAIRTGIFARRREIHIMRLVGATEGFIRLPFLLEGMLLGLGGAVVASLVTAGLYHVYAATMHADLPFLPVVAEASADQTILPLMLGVGLVIGLVASQLSIRRGRI